MLLFHLIGAMIAQPQERPASPNSAPIVIEETGVATSYESVKNISCGEVQWRVNWKSTGRGQIRGTITAVINGRSKVVSEAQSELFGKLEIIDGVSATCNKGKNGQPSRSVLLVRGYSALQNKGVMAQLHVDRQFKAHWSSTVVD